MRIVDYWERLKSVLGLGLSLAKANFKLRNEGSFLGVFWYLLEPLLLFGVILGINAALFKTDLKSYALYLLLGLIMFNFFSGLTTRATGLITGNASFIKSVRINYESLVVSQVLEGIFSHFFEVILFIGFMVYFKASLIWILLYPIIFGFFVLFILGLSFILVTLGVYVVDLNNVWRVITTLLFFLTPIFYMVDKESFLYNISIFNPIFYFLNIAREFIIYNRIPEYWMIAVMVGISLVFFISGVIIFEKFKNKFAEMV